ncbi:MAG: hypothetical protein GY716_05810, partial [bacterium]|nr:hypothetical protein [bacterium]
NGTETCNEATDSCDAGTPPACADGLFCNGAEACNEATDSCDAGTAPSCGDGVGCTVDSCNEGTDSCDNVATNSLCDNGDFCDGAETCDAVNDCQTGSDPCPGQSCDEGADSCTNLANNNNCIDGLWCNGDETCDAVNDCQAGSDPCPGQSCDEGDDQCVACIVDADCSDGAFCNGAETCNAGVCQGGTPVVCDDGAFCNGTESCNEGTDSCDAGTPPACDDGQFCNGAESCNEAADSCDAGTPPCTGGEVCDEGTDSCNVPGGDPVIWMSFRSNTAVPGVGTVADEDVVSYDEGSGTWALEFDGSDVGLGSLEISGLGILPSGDLLLSFTAAGTVGGLSVDDSDVVQFTPTSLGATTAGTFSLYFDGSDVSLTSNGEDVDGIAFHADGRLIVSTTGGFSGTGASGADEDLFLFTGTLGSSTSGSFVRHFDGSDVGLGGNSAEDVDAATFTAGGELLLSTVGSFAVTGLSGADEDVARFTGSFGSSTSGTFSMRQDLTALGIISNEDIGSMHVVE